MTSINKYKGKIDDMKSRNPDKVKSVKSVKSDKANKSDKVKTSKNDIFIKLSHKYKIKIKINPNMLTKTIATMEDGSKLKLDENKTIIGGLCNGDNRWYKIILNDGKIGYVSLQFAKTIS